MKRDTLISRLASLEEEIKVIKSQLAELKLDEAQPKKFSSLKGIWKGKVSFSMEEIKAVEIKL